MIDVQKFWAYDPNSLSDSDFALWLQAHNEDHRLYWEDLRRHEKPRRPVPREKLLRKLARQAEHRAEALRRFGGVCQRCGSGHRLHFHHKEGAIPGGRERRIGATQEAMKNLEAFELLCVKCHGKAHAGDKRKGRVPCQ